MNETRHIKYLEQDTTFVLVHSCDVSRPNAEVVLLDVVGSCGVVILPVVLSELQGLHDPPEQNVVQLKNVQSMLENEVNFKVNQSTICFAH